MFFHGLAAATPPRRFTQIECWEAFQRARQFAGLSARSRGLLRKVLLGRSGIDTRCLALNRLDEAFELTPDVLHARFAREAPELAVRAAEQALAGAGVEADVIDAVIVSTCTGYTCPGLTSPVAERLGLRDDVLALDLVGQGCGAAVPNLRAARALLAGGGCGRVLSVCVEVCSAALYLDDDPGVLISACLFGDGAAAAVLGADAPGKGRSVKWVSEGSLLDPSVRDELRFEMKDGMLRNRLAREVPEIASARANTLLGRMLEARAARKQEVATWILHGGGRDVLEAMQERLKLTAGDLKWSYQMLREVGNVSSPFVLFALERAIRNGAPGGLWWLATFGAGFSCHGAFLQVD